MLSDRLGGLLEGDWMADFVSKAYTLAARFRNVSADCPTDIERRLFCRCHAVGHHHRWPEKKHWRKPHVRYRNSDFHYKYRYSHPSESID